MVNRDEYLEKIKNVMWDGNIKVITGLRRSGKSTLLFEIFYNYLLKQNVSENNIIKFELDKRKYFAYRNPIALCDFVEKKISSSDEKYYLFIDEIQMCKKVKITNEYDIDEVTIYDMLNELKDYKNLDVYVTGSNSKMLSSDIATEFRGRSSQIRVYPLSFKEFYSYYGGNEKDAFDRYMLLGGMPGQLEKKNDREKMQYLVDLFNETYLKDLKEHGKIQREDIMNNILEYLSSSISSLTNPNNIANAISGTGKEKIDPNLISSYIEKLKDAFLIAEVKRYDIKGKSFFSYPNKYYYSDIGLRNAKLNFREFDYGHIQENIIYNELISRGYKVDVGVVIDRKNNQKVQKEIDFIVNNLDRKIYIQSALRIDQKDKMESETRSLKLTGDNFKKVLLRNDIVNSYYDEEGIYNCRLIDFLLGRTDII